jgi:excinuclease ABC subunit A
MAKKTATAPVASAPKPPKAAPKKAAKSAAPAAEILTAAAQDELVEVAEQQAPDLRHDLPVGRQPAPEGLAVAEQHQTPATLPPPAEGPLLGAAAEAPYIEVYGAREHNLKNVSVRIPRGKLVVFTGISGSGKSSLAFDTIYAEGQRRYMETFSAYARSFMGGLERPNVDKIEGLSPVISIEQKTTSRNPRSTVGTITEIYDFLRLLYARTAEAFSYATGKKMIRQSDDQIINYILRHFDGKKLIVLAPVVKGRKGHYREDFQKIAKLGFTKVRVDGELLDITPKMQVDRYKIHDIEIVIDRIVVKEEDRFRLSGSVQNAMTHGKGTMLVLDPDAKKAAPQFFSRFLMDPETGIAYDDPAPNTFSFNSPYGACPH